MWLLLCERRCTLFLLTYIHAYQSSVHNTHTLSYSHRENISKTPIKHIEKKFVNKLSNAMIMHKTNRPVGGWDSIYRSMVTALINTSPRQVSKSSTEDSALLHLAVYCVISWQQADITSSLADAISPQRGCVEWTYIQPARINPRANRTAVCTEH